MAEKNQGVYVKMHELGVVLPSPPKDTATLSIIRSLSNDTLYLSGIGCNLVGEEPLSGKAGEVDDKKAYLAARNTALNALAALDQYLGDLNRITCFVKLLVFVASKPDFYQQPAIANGASELIISIFGDEIGKSARSAVGVASLPSNFIVETEMVVRYK